jgi:hypothetical protein
LNKTVEIFLEKYVFPSVNSTFLAIFLEKNSPVFLMSQSGKRKKKTLLVWVGKIIY